ncbi:unnamed protein product [Vitrella brassicaformis CCMP3155]|uniref:Uncharacterized protein n=1 Tax=Vitrella brassicaformis (strain CCMP3155) TaxID=1169540 RepID=A0A0G4G3Y8_VITBC|nr:unnamed protein product [Vitrella brassicaformis CCMP3155]|mmetsp:Transcript_46375/g.115385  ORF Transcript_46375/g.115385 Transcript_46375/m.115385 type:complete len:90 (-) Transcript_46375:928-1197(-)|eukprot:CEM23126.1 unnamed protein product [Vitrella brassicaformis CCMP3155]
MNITGEETTRYTEETPAPLRTLKKQRKGWPEYRETEAWSLGKSEGDIDKALAESPTGELRGKKRSRDDDSTALAPHKKRKLQGGQSGVF